jgi:DNA-binding MarR family transcriptional regulator
MTTKGYRIWIARGGEEFEVEGDKAFVLKMLERFEPNGNPKTSIDAQSSQKNRRGKQNVQLPPTKGKSVSIREFVQQLGLKKHTDITLAFGYYLERQADTTEFTPADINNCYYEAKIESSNTSQMIIQNIRRGFMMLSKSNADKGRKRYTLTSSGEKYIEAKIAGGAS